VGKLRLTLTTFDEKGVRNNGVHLNMVGRRANGPSWIDKISNRGPNYPYHEFTWGSITWGSKDNPVPGYGTKKVTTQREARQQYADKNNGADPLGGIAGGSAGTAGLSSINNNPPPPQAPGKRNVVYQDTTYVWDVTNARWYWTKPDRSSDWVSYREAHMSSRTLIIFLHRPTHNGALGARVSRADESGEVLSLGWLICSRIQHSGGFLNGPFLHQFFIFLANYLVPYLASCISNIRVARTVFIGTVKLWRQCFDIGSSEVYCKAHLYLI
jgi:hypothetical protein